ncbi:PAAR domain-containing protein [Selenomonas sp. F0473]|uniref:PAAR domain-containing protein n=1 Tax=Selenomonas sp. F0473 TaxID=999423 RepID=UPI0025E74CA6|nr:PAAR domain-containing protein [Selenomonas sp. F0473]
MPEAVRYGDGTTGTCDLGLPCCPHERSGTVNVVSGNVFVNGRGLHRLSDTGPTNCPHGGTFESTKGSGTVFCNGKPVVRIGDATRCKSCGQSGSHTTGSGNVFVGG